MTSPSLHEGPRWQPVLSRALRRELTVLTVLWCLALIYLWAWWLQPMHILGIGAFVTSSAVLTWITLLPIYFVVVAAGARRLTGPLALQPGARVAMVVTKAPSEPFEVVTRTLEGMLAQDVKHDAWLADEAPTDTMRQWCKERGVQISTRFGREDYHRSAWPRRTRCKEGNLAFFYDYYGYDNYDFVAQLDADHVPEPNYLREMLRPFADPRVGYVSAPSICDANAQESWSARGRLYVEAPLHGIVQAGYNNDWAPLCIGSHYAVRTAALREIGGLGPELAEDHSTTLMMNARGWRGVHALDAIAHGDGPRTFVDLITQEYQWSRSLVTILLEYTPKYIRSLPFRLQFQFLFSQLWYPLFSFTMALMFTIPIVALAMGVNLINVTYPQFLAHAAPAWVIVMIMWFRWRASGSYRPSDGKVLSWEVLVFMLARWPWVLVGTVAAVRDRFKDSFVDFRVTPKGRDLADRLPMRVLTPYIAIAVLSLGTALVVGNAGPARGFYLIAIINGASYVVVMLAIIWAHARENGIARNFRSARTFLQVAVTLAIAALAMVALDIRGLQGLQGLSYGSGRLSLVKTTYRVSGAGQGRGVEKLVFSPTWRNSVSIPSEEAPGTMQRNELE